MKISFDYDGVLNSYDYNPNIPYPPQDEPRVGMRELVDRLHNEGHELWIVTARAKEIFERVEEDLIRWGINKYFHGRIISREDKARYCTAAHINIHIDDHPSIIQQFYDERSTTIPIHFLPGLPSMFDLHADSVHELYTLIRLIDTGVVTSLKEYQTARKQQTDEYVTYPISQIAVPNKYAVPSRCAPVGPRSTGPSVWDKS